MLVELCQCWAVWAKLDWANRGLEFPEMGGGGAGRGGLECFWNGGVLTPLPTMFYHWNFHTALVDCGYFAARFQNCFILFTTYVTQFCLISRGESLFFYRISKGKVTNLKTAGGGAVFTTNFLRGRSSSSTLSKKEIIPEYKSKRSISKSNNKWTR